MTSQAPNHQAAALTDSEKSELIHRCLALVTNRGQLDHYHRPTVRSYWVDNLWISNDDSPHANSDGLRLSAFVNECPSDIRHARSYRAVFFADQDVITTLRWPEENQIYGAQALETLRKHMVLDDLAGV